MLHAQNAMSQPRVAKFFVTSPGAAGGGRRRGRQADVCGRGPIAASARFDLPKQSLGEVTEN